MNIPQTSGVNLGSDADLEAAIRQFERELTQSQAHLEAEKTAAEATVAEIETRLKTPPESQPNPAQLAQWREMEATFGTPVQPETGPPTSLADEWLKNAGQELAETAVEEVLEEGAEDLVKDAAKRLGKAAPPRPGARRQWFYEKAGEASDPLPEQDLLKMFEDGALPWTTLVWHRTLRDWTPADQTELGTLARPATPPPLASRKQKTGDQPQAPVCPACGKTGKVEDRFCPACGQPMAS